MATKKAPAKKVPANGYTATLTINGRKYASKGATIPEAIAGITVDGVPKFRGVLTVASADWTMDRVLAPFALQRLFALSPMMREVQLKQLSTLFGA